MNKPTRYDESRFVGPIPSSLICSICLGLVVDPRECIHCDNMHCCYCLYEARKWSGKCPLCQNPISSKPIHRLVRQSVYDPVPLKCCNAPDCEVITTLGEVERHESNCPFGKVACKCGDTVLRKELQEHSMQCSCRLVSCEYCASSVEFKAMQDHLTSCDCIPYSCNHCAEKITKRSTVAHLDVCPELPLTCMWCNETKIEPDCDMVVAEDATCSEIMPQRLFDIHQKEQCKFRKVNCQHCQQSVQAFALEHHIKTQCETFAHTCDLCEASYTLPEKHKALRCPLVEVTCPVSASGCQYKCLRRDLPQHFADPAVSLSHIQALLLQVEDTAADSNNENKENEDPRIQKYRAKLAKCQEQLDDRRARCEDLKDWLRAVQVEVPDSEEEGDSEEEESDEEDED